jgi:tetratricopeptide (TPR) repeat protein
LQAHSYLCIDMKQFALILFTLLCFSVFAASGPAPKGPTPSAPQSANDFFQIGFSASNSGQYDVAIKNYTMAIDLDPNRIYFFYHRGLAHKALGEKAQAIADFNQCLAMKPIAEAYYEIGAFKYEDLDLRGAKEYFEKAKELKDDVDKTNYYLGVINYRMNNFDSAEALLSHYVHLVKTNSDAFLYLALVKVKMHKFDEVTPMLKLAGLYNDNDWKLHLKMYDIYKEMGDKDNMLAHISMVIELGQTKPEFYAIRAQLYLERGENLRAEYDLQYAKGGK